MYHFHGHAKDQTDARANDRRNPLRNCEWNYAHWCMVVQKATAHDLTENNGPMVLCLGALFFAVSGVVLLVAGRLRKRRRLGMITTIDYE